MKRFSFLQKHGYTLFVTALVLALGLITLHLRASAGDAPASVPISAATAVPAPTPSSAPDPVWLRPVSGGILTPYSADEPLWNDAMACWQTHPAVDIAAAPDESVHAAAAGTVRSVTEDPLLGLTVVLSHPGGWESVYASLSSACCRPGHSVRAGEVIGSAGHTADGETSLPCHLHFALFRDSLPFKPTFRAQ